MTLSEMLVKFSNGFNDVKKRPFRSDFITKLVTADIPLYILDELHLNTSKYLTNGSCGKGQWSEVPWVAILNKDITKSTQNGYYIVYLYDANLKTIHLSLALGWTQFLESYGTKQGRLEIQKIGIYFSKQLRIKPEGFKSGPINLNAQGDLAKGYELGQIFSKEYDLTNLPSENILFDDLRMLLGSYDELVGLVGNSIFNISIESDKTVEENEMQKTIISETFKTNKHLALKNIVDIANAKPAPLQGKFIKQVMRTPYYAALVKERAFYICEICKRKPFIQTNGKPYAEADHIDQLSKTRIDHPDTMRCLCAQCHAIITYGSKEEIENLLQQNKR